MKSWIRKGGIYFGALLSGASYTVISPFYPAVALRQGVPSWLFGFVFATFPVASLIFSFFLPKIMRKVGRNPIFVLSLVFLSSSNIVISFLESCPTPAAIFVSFLSRALSGLGAACGGISSYAILTSDYPKEVSQLIPVLEVVSGLGAIIGPSAGSLIFAFGGFSTSCFSVGITIAIFVPIIWKVLGPSSEYVISSDTIRLREVWFRPVFDI